MLEEENFSTDTHQDVVTVVGQSQSSTTHFKSAVGSSSQTAPKVYATTAEAIANFKPTRRDVISGIAPHVFDEQKRRRHRRQTSLPSRTYWCGPGGEKRPSPLRGTIVNTWDERSIYIDQANSQHHHHSKENIETSSICTFGANVQLQEAAHCNTGKNLDSDNLKSEALWKYLRIDTHLLKLKTIAVKLKYTRVNPFSIKRSL